MLVAHLVRLHKSHLQHSLAVSGTGMGRGTAGLS